VKHPAQAIPAQYRSALRGCCRCRLPRRALAQALVGPRFLVVLDELLQHVLEVAASKDQQMVEQLAPGCPHPSLDATVRAEYERALELAKTRLGPIPGGRTRLPMVTDGNWQEAPAVKARLAGGFCLRAPAQGACPYANICEHCPNFGTDASYLPVLAAQRLDAGALAADAEARGWITEADRHRRLLARLDALIAEAQAG
jgi:hypothetical protein